MARHFERRRPPGLADLPTGRGRPHLLICKIDPLYTDLFKMHRRLQWEIRSMLGMSNEWENGFVAKGTLP